MTKPKRPRDPNQLAKLVIDIATGEVEPENPDAGKDPAAVALGRKGGAKGGKARAEKLGREGLSRLGKAGARARWPVNEPREGSASPQPKKRKVLSVDPEGKR